MWAALQNPDLDCRQVWFQTVLWSSAVVWAQIAACESSVTFYVSQTALWKQCEPRKPSQWSSSEHTAVFISHARTHTHLLSSGSNQKLLIHCLWIGCTVPLKARCSSAVCDMNLLILLFHSSLLTSCETNLLLTAESGDSSCVFRVKGNSLDPPPGKGVKRRKINDEQGTSSFCFTVKLMKRSLWQLLLLLPLLPPPLSIETGTFSYCCFFAFQISLLKSFLKLKQQKSLPVQNWCCTDLFFLCLLIPSLCFWVLFCSVLISAECFILHFVLDVFFCKSDSMSIKNHHRSGFYWDLWRLCFVWEISGAVVHFDISHL